MAWFVDFLSDRRILEFSLSRFVRWRGQWWFDRAQHRGLWQKAKDKFIEMFRDCNGKHYYAGKASLLLALQNDTDIGDLILNPNNLREQLAACDIEFEAINMVGMHRQVQELACESAIRTKVADLRKANGLCLDFVDNAKKIEGRKISALSVNLHNKSKRAKLVAKDLASKHEQLIGHDQKQLQTLGKGFLKTFNVYKAKTADTRKNYIEKVPGGRRKIKATRSLKRSRKLTPWETIATDEQDRWIEAALSDSEQSNAPAVKARSPPQSKRSSLVRAECMPRKVRRTTATTTQNVKVLEMQEGRFGPPREVTVEMMKRDKQKTHELHMEERRTKRDYDELAKSYESAKAYLVQAAHAEVNKRRRMKMTRRCNDENAESL